MGNSTEPQNDGVGPGDYAGTALVFVFACGLIFGGMWWIFLHDELRRRRGRGNAPQNAPQGEAGPAIELRPMRPQRAHIPQGREVDTPGKLTNLPHYRSTIRFQRCAYRPYLLGNTV